MRVEDFPRPKDDNRRGMCWSATSRHPTGEALDFWLAELRAMQVRWVRVADNGQGSSVELCKRLLASDIMPIALIDRGAQPNPGRLGNRELEVVRQLVAEGVRYFETNHEPDLVKSWQGPRPENWSAIVIENFVADAEQVLRLGGLPALPALSADCRADLVQALVERRRQDLLSAGVWLAAHSYTLNRPLDYPFDPVSRTGQAVSQADYDRLGTWAWDGRPRDVINQWRQSDRWPEPSLAEAGACFLSFGALSERAAKAAGQPVPVISTEGGPVVGWHDDRRYPRIDPQGHATLVSTIDDYLRGKGSIGGVACPPNYLALCHSVMANARLGAPVDGWENVAWYTNRWDEQFGLRGALPAVAVFKGNQQAVPQQRTVATRSMPIRTTGPEGTQRNPSAEGVASVGGSIPAAPNGTVPASKPGNVTGNVAPESAPEGPSESALGGKVFDHKGAPAGGIRAVLSRGGEQVQEARTAADGTFRFYHLPAGRYEVGLETVRVAGIALDGTLKRGIKLTLGAPGATTAQVDGLIQGGEVGWEVTLTGPSGRRQMELGPEGSFAFADLEPGSYQVNLEPVGDILSDVDLVPGGLLKLIFPLHSALTGRVIGAATGTRAVLYAPAPWNWMRQCLLDLNGEFVFDRLPPGKYRLQVAGQSFANLLLTGENRYELPPIAPSATAVALSGHVWDAAGLPVAGAWLVLLRDGLFAGRVQTEADGTYRFTRLAPGTYTLQTEDGRQVSGEITFSGQENVSQDMITPALTGISPAPGLRDMDVSRGQAAAIGDGQPAAAEDAKPLIAHYFLFGPSAPRSGSEDALQSEAELKLTLGLALESLRRLGATGGFSLGEAKRATQVTIVGNQVPEDAEAVLRSAGCQVTRLAGDSYALARSFSELLATLGEG